MRDWEACKNLLAIRLDNMGDVIMSNAALKEIKHNLPTTKLTLLTSTMGAPIVPYLDSVDASITFDVPWMKLQDSQQQSALYRLIEELKALQFDGCMIFNVYSQNIFPAALLAYLAEIPLRAAYARENPYHLLTHWYPDPEPLTEINHQIKRDLKLVQFLGISRRTDRLPTLRPVDNVRPDHARNLSSPYILLNAEVSEQKRQYQPDRVRDLVQKLLARGETVVFTGQQPSVYLDSCIAGIQHPSLINLVGQTSIEDLLCLVQEAKGIISVNTGIAHIACAYRRPILVLYADTNPQHVPWSPNSTFITYGIPDHLQSKNQIIKYVNDRSAYRGADMPATDTVLSEFYALL